MEERFTQKTEEIRASWRVPKETQEIYETLRDNVDHIWDTNSTRLYAYIANFVPKEVEQFCSAIPLDNSPKNPLKIDAYLGRTIYPTMDQMNDRIDADLFNAFLSILYTTLTENKYPEFKFISSTTKCLENLDAIRAELQKDYYLVVTDSSLNNTDELFSLEPKDKIEVLVNHYCQDHCPRRQAHYNAIGKAQLEYSELEFPPCKYTARSFYKIMENRSFITTDMVFGKYKNAGFKHFKVDGRAHAARNIIDSFLYYLVKPDHRDDLRLFILQEFHKI